MFTELPIEIIGALTPGALLGVCVLYIITGRLVPLKSHERELSTRDEEIIHLRNALDICYQSAQRRAEQVSELLECSRVTVEIIKSLRATIVSDVKNEEVSS